MSEVLKYKKWNQWIVFGIPLLLLVLVFGVFSRTWEMYEENRTIRSKIEKGEGAPEQIGLLNNRLHHIKARFNAYSLDSLKNREYLLLVVSSFCKKNNLILKEFPVIGVEEHRNIGLMTNTIVAEGDFKNLLKLLYELEQKVGVGRPSSVCFEKNYDFKRKKDVLQMTIYLQTISLKNEN